MGLRVPVSTLDLLRLLRQAGLHDAAQRRDERSRRAAAGAGRGDTRHRAWHPTSSGQLVTRHGHLGRQRFRRRRRGRLLVDVVPQLSDARALGVVGNMFFLFSKKIALLHYSNIYRRQRRTPITMNYSLLSTLQRVIQISAQVQAYIEAPSAIYQPYHIIIKKESRDRRGATACRGVAGLSSCRGMTSATPKAGLCASWQQRAWSCAPDACWRDAATAR